MFVTKAVAVDHHPSDSPPVPHRRAEQGATALQRSLQRRSSSSATASRRRQKTRGRSWSHTRLLLVQWRSRRDIGMSRIPVASPSSARRSALPGSQALGPRLIVSWPSSALASWTAARNVQVFAAVAQTPSPMLRSGLSAVSLTVIGIAALARSGVSARTAARARAAASAAEGSRPGRALARPAVRCWGHSNMFEQWGAMTSS
jgi:hypothetical protein